MLFYSTDFSLKTSNLLFVSIVWTAVVRELARRKHVEVKLEFSIEVI